jgi:hypothetical protein
LALWRRAANDDVVEHVNLQELSGANQIARHFDVRLAWRRVAAYAVSGISGVIPHPVLCRNAYHSPDFSGREKLCNAA